MSDLLHEAPSLGFENKLTVNKTLKTQEEGKVLVKEFLTLRKDSCKADKEDLASSFLCAPVEGKSLKTPHKISGDMVERAGKLTLQISLLLT